MEEAVHSPFRPFYLAGPTGSGKTGVSLALARLHPPVEIVNADAFQVYRGLEILSAAPSSGERAVCSHHFFSCLDPSEENDAAAFAGRVHEILREVSQRARPLVVGGSGLYLKALTHGLAPTPKGNPELRAELETRTLADLVEQYRALDPEGAAHTDLQNRRYVTRNLEICLLSGRPASELKRRWAAEPSGILGVYLQRERSDLDDRISRRTDAMFASGVIHEVAALGPLSTTAAKAIGIREIQSLLRGEISERECREAIRLATRRYAKRQETWFRREASFLKLPVPPDESPEDTAHRLFAALLSP